MPTQLYKNSAISFVCARDFVWAGKEYQIGETFDQDIAPGRIDLLIRTRRLFAVVEDKTDKPRHWHHHVWTTEQVAAKLGRPVGSSGYNKPVQFGGDEDVPATEDAPADQPGEPDHSDGESIDVSAAEDQSDETGSEAYDPSEDTIPEVEAYIAENPNQIETVIEAEEAGKNRSTLLATLYKELEKRDG